MSDNARSYAQTSFAPTTTAGDIAAQNANRKALIIFNTGSVGVSIGIGTAVIPIAPGNHLAFTNGTAPINAITAQAASGTGALVVWEA